MNKFLQVLELEAGNNKEHKIEAIRDNAVYAKKINGHLLGLYYLIAWKNYSEEKNI